MFRTTFFRLAPEPDLFDLNLQASVNIAGLNSFRLRSVTLEWRETTSASPFG